MNIRQIYVNIILLYIHSISIFILRFSYFVQFFVSVALVFLVVHSTTPVNSQQEAYVDKWEPFDIQNSPHVDRFESNYNKFGASPESQVGTIHEVYCPEPSSPQNGQVAQAILPCLIAHHQFYLGRNVVLYAIFFLLLILHCQPIITCYVISEYKNEIVESVFAVSDGF